MSDEKRLRDIYRIRLRDRRQVTYKKYREDVPAIASILQGLFRAPEDSRKIQEQRLLLAWPKIVGESITKNTTAHRVRDNRLYVEVRDPMWRQELVFQKSNLLTRIRSQFPDLKISDIHFTI